jgi:ATP-dependent DNA ligase
MSDLLALTGRPKNKFIQLAQPLEKVNPDKLTWPRWVSEKIDGVYCIAHKDFYGVITTYSRTGEIYTSMEHIAALLWPVLDKCDLIIFEAYIPGKWQAEASGAARDTKAQHPELVPHCHDLLFEKEFTEGGGRPYYERNADLYFRLCEKGMHRYYASQTAVEDIEAAQKYAQIIIDQGREGAVMRNPSAPYSPGKRNPDIIKIKQGVSYDLEVLDMYEGKGKYAGTLGGLICKWKDGQTIQISGMTDQQRHDWWNEVTSIIGKIVQVDAMTNSSKGLLREPRFKGIRHDKVKGDF